MGSILALTLFGSFVWFVISLVLFLVICFASEVNENGYVAFISLLLFAGVYYLWGDISSALSSFSWSILFGYLMAGLIYAITRTFFKGRELGEDIKDLPTKEDSKKQGTPYYGDTKESVTESFKRDLKENVFRWWLMWPISLITWICSDLIRDVWNFLYKHLGNFFNYILDFGSKTA
jgi:hypothetical protein